MSLNIFWFLPTHGDGKYLGTAEGARAVDHGYLTQIAQAADRLGFGGVLIPTGRSCEDSWLVAASLIPVTQNLKFLVALRPGIISPTVAARQAATLDRLSGGRALFNLVTGGDPDELAGDGLHLSHEERYEASVEFTRIWRRVLEGEASAYRDIGLAHAPQWAATGFAASGHGGGLRLHQRRHHQSVVVGGDAAALPVVVAKCETQAAQLGGPHRREFLTEPMPAGPEDAEHGLKIAVASADRRQSTNTIN